MDSAATNPQPPDPPRELISSERVRFLTSWKLWLPMLFVALLLIAASIIWPAYQRMRALDLISAKGGEYFLGDAESPWLASRLGRLGDGFRPVHGFAVFEPISLVEFQSLQVLSEAKAIDVSPDRLTSAWIEALTSFPEVVNLYLDGDATVESIQHMLESHPTLDRLFVGNVTTSGTLHGANCGLRLEELRIEQCRQSLTIEEFPALRRIVIREGQDAQLSIQELPALAEIRVVNLHDETSLSLDTLLPCFSCVRVDALELAVPDHVREMSIENIAACTITGGAHLESLGIGEGSNVRLQSLPKLNWFSCRHRLQGWLALHGLPELDTLDLRWAELCDLTSIECEGVDNLRVIGTRSWPADVHDVAALCELPRLEQFVIPMSKIDENTISMLLRIHTLRFLRIPRRFQNGEEVDFAQLRREFPQPGVRIHGPHKSSESRYVW